MKRVDEDVQFTASQYVQTICDLCLLATPDAEDEDYSIASLEECPEVFCEGRAEKVKRGGTREKPVWTRTCKLFVPDIQRVRSVMAHMAMDNAKGLAALDELTKRG